jgi:hypothetical protein
MSWKQNNGRNRGHIDGIGAFLEGPPQFTDKATDDLNMNKHIISNITSILNKDNDFTIESLNDHTLTINGNTVIENGKNELNISTSGFDFSGNTQIVSGLNELNVNSTSGIDFSGNTKIVSGLNELNINSTSGIDFSGNTKIVSGLNELNVNSTSGIDFSGNTKIVSGTNKLSINSISGIDFSGNMKIGSGLNQLNISTNAIDFFGNTEFVSGTNKLSINSNTISTSSTTTYYRTFKGAETNFTIVGDASLNLLNDISNSWTIECWIINRATDPINVGIIYAHGGTKNKTYNNYIDDANTIPNPNPYYGLNNLNGSTYTLFIHENKFNFSTGPDSNGVSLVSAVPIVNGEWVHVAVVYNSTNSNLTMFQNGNIVSSNYSGTLLKEISPDFNNDNSLYIGHIDSAESYDYFIGDISNLHITKTTMYTSQFISHKTPLLLPTIDKTVLLTLYSLNTGGNKSISDDKTLLSLHNGITFPDGTIQTTAYIPEIKTIGLSYTYSIENRTTPIILPGMVTQPFIDLTHYGYNNNNNNISTPGSISSDESIVYLCIHDIYGTNNKTLFDDLSNEPGRIKCYITLTDANGNTLSLDVISIDKFTKINIDQTKIDYGLSIAQWAVRNNARYRLQPTPGNRGDATEMTDCYGYSLYPIDSPNNSIWQYNNIYTFHVSRKTENGVVKQLSNNGISLIRENINLTISRSDSLPANGNLNLSNIEASTSIKVNGNNFSVNASGNVTGNIITANNKFVGNLEGNVTGNVTFPTGTQTVPYIPTSIPGSLKYVSQFTMDAPNGENLKYFENTVINLPNLKINDIIFINIGPYLAYPQNNDRDTINLSYGAILRKQFDNTNYRQIDAAVPLTYLSLAQLSSFNISGNMIVPANGNYTIFSYFSPSTSERTFFYIGLTASVSIMIFNGY